MILKKNNGQHTIELIVLLTLIAAGVLVMGPYVVRSWNANVKGWEDSAIDSFEDPLGKVPSTTESSDCIAGEWTPQGCGISLINFCSGETNNCPPTEMGYTRSFNPRGCQCNFDDPVDQQILRCEPNECCCMPPLAVACGVNMSHGQAPPDCASTDLIPTTPQGCPEGYMGISIECGGENYVGCRADPACLTYCEESLLPVTLTGEMNFFPQTPAGSYGQSSCPTCNAQDCTWQLASHECSWNTPPVRRCGGPPSPWGESCSNPGEQCYTNYTTCPAGGGFYANDINVFQCNCTGATSCSQQSNSGGTYSWKEVSNYWRYQVRSCTDRNTCAGAACDATRASQPGNLNRCQITDCSGGDRHVIVRLCSADTNTSPPSAPPRRLCQSDGTFGPLENPCQPATTSQISGGNWIFYSCGQCPNNPVTNQCAANTSCSTVGDFCEINAVNPILGCTDWCWICQ